MRESHIAATIDHPNIIPIYDAGEADGCLYIAMRYVEGRDLKEIRKRGALGVGRTIFLLEQLASALDAAHAHALVHRDVKPGNILCRGEHRPRLPHRLRRREADDCARPDLDGPLPRHGRVRGSRADRGTGRRRAHRRLCARLRPVRVPHRVAAVRAGHGTRRPARAPRRSATVREPCAARSARGVRQRGCDRDGEGGGGPVRHRAESSPTPLATRQAERHGGSTAARRVTCATIASTPASVPAAGPEPEPEPAPAVVPPEPARQPRAPGRHATDSCQADAADGAPGRPRSDRIRPRRLLPDQHRGIGGSPPAHGPRHPRARRPRAGADLGHLQGERQAAPGALETAACLPPANATTFTPDHLEVSTYASGAAVQRAYEAERRLHRRRP